MSGVTPNNGEEALNQSIGLLKKLQIQFPKFKIIAYLIAFLSAGGGTTFLWIWDKAQDHIINVATPKIIHLSDSIANVKIVHVIDSINEIDKGKQKLGEQLSQLMHVERDSLPYKIGDWFNREKNIFQVGLYVNKLNDKVLYRHVDGHVYRAIFKPQRDYYYYFDDNGQWKQVK